MTSPDKKGSSSSQSSQASPDTLLDKILDIWDDFEELWDDDPNEESVKRILRVIFLILGVVAFVIYVILLSRIEDLRWLDKLYLGGGALIVGGVVFGIAWRVISYVYKIAIAVVLIGALYVNVGYLFLVFWSMLDRYSSQRVGEVFLFDRGISFKQAMLYIFLLFIIDLAFFAIMHPIFKIEHITPEDD